MNIFSHIWPYAEEAQYIAVAEAQCVAVAEAQCVAVAEAQCVAVEEAQCVGVEEAQCVAVEEAQRVVCVSGQKYPNGSVMAPNGLKLWENGATLPIKLFGLLLIYCLFISLMKWSARGART